MNQQIAEKWNQIKEIVSESESDVEKNAKGNASAGVRARKSLRLLKKELSALIKMTLEANKKQQE